MWRWFHRLAGSGLGLLRVLAPLASLGRALRDGLSGLKLWVWSRRILAAASGLVTRIAGTGGRVPRRPRPAPMAHYDHPRVRGMSRRAALFLFEQCGLGLVPAQFWPVLEETGDPGESLTLFLDALGCDPVGVARGDPEARGKAAEVMDLLVRAGDLLSRLSAEARDALAERLQAGDHDTVRTAAEVAADLNAGLAIERRWQGEPVMAVFEAALTALRPLAADPLRADPEAVRDAADRLQVLSDAQARLKSAGTTYGALAETLAREWPEAWDGGPLEQELLAAIGDFERVNERLWNDAELSPEELPEKQSWLLASLETLEALLARARAHNAEASARAERERAERARRESEAASARARRERAERASRETRAKARPRGDLEEALVYFGFPADARPSMEEAKRARSVKFKAVHPDFATDETERMQRHYEIQLAYAHWEAIKRLMDR